MERHEVLAMYDSHCGYCGAEISLKTMEVTAIIPSLNDAFNRPTNLMPACRTCAKYKRAHSAGRFKEMLYNLHDRLGKMWLVKVAVAHGLVSLRPFDGSFYYEKTIKHE
ncbi:HNH endonuclease [bacterium]|nr:HNH endonuclease [bacterium]